MVRSVLKLSSRSWSVKELLSSFLLHRKEFDLTDIGFFRRLFKHRAFQWAVITPNLLVFVIVVWAGFVGTPVGNMNFAVVFVWIVWWFALMTVLVPLFSRLWCLICPLPAFGDWLQRRGFIRRAANFKWFGWNKPWPSPIKNLWPVNFIFLFIATFIVLLTTRPVVTGILLLSLFVLGTLLALPFAKRAFCRYVCPVGGFLGLYSMFAAIEIRPKDRTLCEHHVAKECVRGSDTSFGCPWLIYPGGLEKNNYCGLCMECVKACPYDNLAVRIRRFGKDLLVKSGRALDEVYKAHIMLALAVIYIAITQGPWGWLRDWGNVFYKPTYDFALSGLQGFALHATLVWSGALIIAPGIFYLFCSASRALVKSAASIKKIFIDFSYSLIPIGLAGWVGFSTPIIFINWSYVVNVLSDPFGWGWDLLGTKYIPWKPIFPEIVPYIQILAVAIGLIYSIKYGIELSRQIFEDEGEALKAFIPIAIFLMLVSILFIWLFVG